MKYPMINKRTRREISVPDLSGGLNLRDNLTGVRDNQLSECVNMWYKDGLLRTRPNLTSNKNCCYYTNFTNNGLSNNYEAHSIRCHNNIQKSIGNEVMHLVSYSCVDTKSSDTLSYYKIHFAWQNDSNIRYINPITISCEKEYVPYVPKDNNGEFKIGHFLTQKDNYVYCFVAFGSKILCYKMDYENSECFTSFDKIEDYYAPLVIVEDNLVRSYNLLGGRYRGSYELNNAEDKASYTLPQKIPIGSKVKISITNSSGVTEEGVFQFVNSSKKESIIKSFYNGNVKVEIVRDDVSTINFLGSDGNTADNIGGVNNGSLIGGCFEYNSVCDMGDEIHKILCMNQSVWYGSGAEGISGGTRLFLCGNSLAKEKNLVVWSALNNPLYFPENNYAYIGDKLQSVTGFGVQGEYLVIFKEKSTYYSYGKANGEITADDIITQSVIDLESNSTYFVIVQLNGSVGCDCPDTVQLCRNRLVWANSDGNVYTLVSNNQYSERTIFKVSDMVGNMLRQENNLKNASAFDFENHYVLVINNHAYVMDYNSYGYQYVHSYSKTEDSNALIPWYYWEFPNLSETTANNIMSKAIFVNDSIILSSFGTSEDKNNFYFTNDVLSIENNSAIDIYFKFNESAAGSADFCSYQSNIISKLKTKMFDFHTARYLKNIDSLSVILANNGGDDIMVTFVTNVGNKVETVTLDCHDIDERDAAFVTVKNFYPSIKAIRTFGVKIECKGKLFVDGLSIQYRLLGGAK